MKILKIFLFFIYVSFAEVSHSDEDPFQNINEKTHNFNQFLDSSLASPGARFYKTITPDILEVGITNFTHNIEDLSIGINNLLQGKPNDGMSDLLRFTINSTIGFAGFFYIASNLGFTKHDEDFGQTLAVWGIPE